MKKKLEKTAIMFFVFMLVLAFSLSASYVSAAHDNELALPAAGTTPDTRFLYGLELAFERIELALTVGKAAKAEKGLAFAGERLEEVNVMVEANKVEAAERARKEHAKTLAQVETETEALGEDEIAVSKRIMLKKRILASHITAGKIADSLEYKIRIKFREEKLTDAQIDRLHTFLDKLAEENSDIGEEEAEEEELASSRMDAAAERIEDARDEIEEAEKMLADFELDETMDLNAARKHVEGAREKLANAEVALKEGKYGRAFGQATSAQKRAINAQRILERLEKIEERGEVRIRALVSPEAGMSRTDVRAKFVLEFKDREDLIIGILEKMALTPEEVKEIITFKDEGIAPGKRSRGIDVRIKSRYHIARVSFAMKLYLNTADRDEIIQELVNELKGLSPENILQAHELRIKERDDSIKEKLKIRIEERRTNAEENEAEEKELKAKIVIQSGTATIEYEINGEKKDFTLETEDKNEILRELSSRTDIDIDKWREIAEFKRSRRSGE